MPLWLLDDPLKALKDKLLIAVPSSSSQMSLILETQEMCGGFDIDYGLKMFGWRTDNAGHLLRHKGKVNRNDSEPSEVVTLYILCLFTRRRSRCDTEDKTSTLLLWMDVGGWSSFQNSNEEWKRRRDDADVDVFISVNVATLNVITQQSLIFHSLITITMVRRGHLQLKGIVCKRINLPGTMIHLVCLL